MAPISLLRRALMLGVAVAMLAPTGVSAQALEYPVASSGYVFGTAVDASSQTVFGYAVTDDGGIPFWSQYQLLGGRAWLGPAVSGRYICGPSVCQTFERALLRWDPAAAVARPVDVLWYLHHAGQDGSLRQKLAIPAPWNWSDRRGGRDQAVPEADQSALFWASEGLGALANALGPARDVVVGKPEAVERVDGALVLRGTRGAMVDPNPDEAGAGGAYLLGAGQIARAMGLIPLEGLKLAPMAPSAAAPPARLTIPRIGVDASLLALDPAPDGSLPAPKEPQQVAWYTDTARLAEGGNMVIAGHVDWVGRRAAAFRQVGTLTPGDELSVHDAAGTSTQYEVTTVRSYAANSMALRRLMANAGRGGPTLTLVTCSGPFDVARNTYLERTVVEAIPSAVKEMARQEG